MNKTPLLLTALLFSSSSFAAKWEVIKGVDSFNKEKTTYAHIDTRYRSASLFCDKKNKGNLIFGVVTGAVNGSDDHYRYETQIAINNKEPITVSALSFRNSRLHYLMDSNEWSEYLRNGSGSRVAIRTKTKTHKSMNRTVDLSQFKKSYDKVSRRCD